MGEVEPAGAGESDVQLLFRIRGEESEVEVKPAFAALWKGAHPLRKVAVPGRVADLQRVIATNVEGRRELDASLGIAVDGEGIRPSRRDPVVEAVADVDGWCGGECRAGRKREHKHRQTDSIHA